MGPQILECTKSRMAWDGVSLEMGEKKSLWCFAHIITFTKWKLSKIHYRHNYNLEKKIIKKKIKMGHPMAPLDSFMCIFMHLNNKTRKIVLTCVGRCGIKSNRYKEFFQEDIVSELVCLLV
jgi:hypothetical protein